MARPFARPTFRWWLALGLCATLASLQGQAEAQDNKGEEFSLDEEEGAAKPPAPAPTPAETAAASEGEGEGLLSDEQAIAEEEAPEEKFRESTDPYEDPKKSYFFVGAAWRYTLLPSFVLEWFLDDAPGLVAPGSFFGEFGYRKNGFQVVAQVGWMKWAFKGPFRAAGDPPEDTEWLVGKFNFLQGTAAITWSTSFTDWFAVEYGVEAGIGGVIGDLTRSEAYHNGAGKWKPCPTFALDPGWPGSVPKDGDSAVYCDVPVATSSGVTPQTNEADEIGAHYNVKAPHGITNKGIPRAVPILGPRVSLRFKPIHQLVLRVDVPLPLFPYGFVGGLSAQFGF